MKSNSHSLHSKHNAKIEEEHKDDDDDSVIMEILQQLPRDGDGDGNDAGGGDDQGDEESQKQEHGDSVSTMEQEVRDAEKLLKDINCQRSLHQQGATTSSTEASVKEDKTSPGDQNLNPNLNPPQLNRGVRLALANDSAPGAFRVSPGVDMAMGMGVSHEQQPSDPPNDDPTQPIASTSTITESHPESLSAPNAVLHHTESYLAEATLVPDQEEQPNADADHRHHVAEARLVKGLFIMTRRTCWLALAATALVFFIGAIVLGVVLTRETTGQTKSENNDNDNDIKTTLPQDLTPRKPTLQRIREEGILRCGVANVAVGAPLHDSPDPYDYVDTAYCRAIAAAAMGDEYEIEIIPHELTERIDLLASGQVDVLFNFLSFTMERDVYIPSIQSGLSFGTPYFYDTSGFAGESKFVDCAQQDPPDKVQCQGLSVCVLRGTHYYDLLGYTISKNQILETDFQGLFDAYINGQCNVLLGNWGSLMRLQATLYEMEMLTEDFTVSGIFTIEPLAPAVREDDIQWRDLVFWVFQALYTAEANNITQISVGSDSIENGHSFLQTTAFGNTTRNMFSDAIGASGHYGEILELVDERMMRKNSFNSINDGTTGIVQSLPLGITDVEGPGPDPDGTLSSILQRRSLRCAVRSNRLGFAERKIGNVTDFEWTGMDVDYCRAVRAAVFGPATQDALEIIDVLDDQEGFEMLQNGDVDVFAGVMITMERDVLEPSTGVGFSFSRPYYYNVSAILAKEDPSEVDLNLCLATSEEDMQWSKFVMWIVEATFFAEEFGMTEFSSNEMPVVSLFGEGFPRMFRDAIYAVGNYGNIYARNVEPYVPRTGLNLAFNKTNLGAPMIPLPGLLD